jgi:hypothetical protein
VAVLAVPAAAAEPSVAVTDDAASAVEPPQQVGQRVAIIMPLEGAGLGQRCLPVVDPLQRVHEPLPPFAHAVPRQRRQRPRHQVLDERHVREQRLADGQHGQQLDPQPALLPLGRREPQPAVALVGPQHPDHAVVPAEVVLVDALPFPDVPPRLRRQHLQRGERRAHGDEVRVPVAEPHKRRRVVGVHGLAGALLVAPVGELRQPPGPRVQLPEVEHPQAGEAGAGLVARQRHEVGHHGVGLRHVLAAPARVDLGQHRDGVQEVAQVVVVVVVDAEPEVGAGVLEPLQRHQPAPFGVVEEAVPLEAAVQPRRHRGLEELLHRRDHVGAPDLLRDQRQPRRPRDRLPVEVGRGGGYRGGREAGHVGSQRGHHLGDAVLANAAGRVPRRGNRVGAQDPGVADHADHIAVDAPVPEVVEHPHGAVVGEQAEVERVGEHEQLPGPVLAPGVVDAEGPAQGRVAGGREAAAVAVEDRLHGRVWEVGDPDGSGEAGRGELRGGGLREADRGRRVEEEGLAAVHPEAPLGAGVVTGGDVEEGMDGRDGDVDGAGRGGDGDVRASADEVRAEGRGDVERDGEVVESRDAVALRAPGGVGDGEVGDEGLDDEGRRVVPRRVADVESGASGGADGVRVDVLRLVPVLEHEVLEEGVGGERRGEERRREEAGRVGHHRGRCAREHGAPRRRRRRAVAAVVRHGGGDEGGKLRRLRRDRDGL